MNRYLLCLIFLGLVACQDEYDGEKRILLDLHVTDRQGNPLSGKHMEVYADDDIEYYFNGDDLVTFGNTDSNGNIRLVFPVRINYESIYALHFPGDDAFRQTAVTHIKEEDCADFKVPITELTLLRQDEVVNLYVQPSQVTNQELVWITIEGLHSGNVSLGLPNLESSYSYYSNFEVAKNSLITIIYTTGLGGTLTQHQQLVEIGTDDLQYTLNY